MIFIDTNYFIYALTEPQDDAVAAMAAVSIDLFRRVASDQIKATTSEAVLAEVIYVLSSSAFNVPRSDIANALERIVLSQGFSSDNALTWLLALQLWEQRSAISFVDALAAAHSMRDDHELATFDRRLSRHPGLKTYRPD
ncbi:MAG: PIN domain-containing protein [Thermomicrobiales bacterium]|nr:PIN domain-containing protein [Thermomicrobiales bacterium]